MRSLRLLTPALLALVLAVPARADHDDRDALDKARRAGKLIPLAELLEKLKPRIGKRVTDIEFEYEDGRAIYEIYWVDAKGRRREIHVDARSGAILDHQEED